MNKRLIVAFVIALLLVVLLLSPAMAYPNDTPDSNKTVSTQVLPDTGNDDSFVPLLLGGILIVGGGYGMYRYGRNNVES